MLIVLDTVDISVPELFIEGGAEKAESIKKYALDFCSYLERAIEGCASKKYPKISVGDNVYEVAGIHVIPPGGDGEPFVLAVRYFNPDISYLMYPTHPMEAVDELRKDLPDWLMDCLDEVNGMKINWSQYA